MTKLFNLFAYLITLPITLLIVLFKTSEADRGVHYNADQSIKDASAMMSGVRNIYNKIDIETDKAVAAR